MGRFFAPAGGGKKASRGPLPGSVAHPEAAPDPIRVEAARPILSRGDAHEPDRFLPPGAADAPRRKAAAGARPRGAPVEAGGTSRMTSYIDEWVGCAYLFLQATSEKDFLPTLYRSPQQRLHVYKVLKLALADSIGGFSGLDILKVHCSDPNLIIQLKFYKQENCRKFLQSYQRGELQEALQKHLKVVLSLPSLEPLKTELKAGAEKLDSIIREEERCLESISQQKPDHLRDEEIAELETSLGSLSFQESSPRSLKCQLPSDSSLPTLNSSPPAFVPPEISKSSVEEDTFFFQNQRFVNRKITLNDHQKFSKLVSKKWKQVGRSLCLQTKCRALRDPFIDNLAIEYEREGLYEQAYQLLRRYIDSEGSKATVRRLVAALEENGLISLAEEILGIHQSDM
ncbi:tumor necrosis factor receptor type 1-associated DEATH domain protein [Erythrolamprus reginae]|uniref:tumor necrosis factor receptor type 1-associated DEATH domain protein n=1 Tax=Erythrolamprus reginae TaxID=121349 RepID=UPI00396C7BAA